MNNLDIDYYNTIRENIKRYRKLNKITQQELADKIGYNKKTISDIENENIKAHSSIQTYCNIAKVLNLSILDLLEPINNEKIINKIEISNENSKNKIREENVFNIIRENIVKYRNYRNLTQEQLSEKSNISKEFLALLETGKKHCTLETLIKISVALNIDIKLLFDI